jgi:deoxyadenosine/deoxycytidine kinase
MLRIPCAEKEYLFSERGVVADKEIFAKLQLREGKMNDMEFQIYLKIFDDLNKLANLHPIHRQIYLRTEPQKCLERMQKRGRKEELNVSIDYLNKIHELHEEWLGNGFIIEGTP